MKNFTRLMIVVFGLLIQPAFAVGLMPVPVLKNVQIRAETRLEPARGWYVYSYAVNNPPQNTGEIRGIKVDILNLHGNYLDGTGLTISIGGDRYAYQSELDELRNNPYWGKSPPLLVPVGQNVPAGWHGGLSIAGFASFSSGNKSVRIKPGASLGGFELVSPGVPTIRDVQIIPKWVLLVDDHDAVTPADREAAGQTEQDIIYKTVSLGPSGVSRGSFAHWNQLRDDLARAVQLGWFPDAALATTLAAQLASARAALDQQDLYLVHQRLDTLLATIFKSTPAQRTAEGYGLVYFNVKAMIDSTGYNTEEPEIKLTPGAAAYPLGATHTVTARVIDLANGGRPMAGLRAYFYVDSGPNQGGIADSETDAEGVAVGSYTGTREGIDNIRVRIYYGGDEGSMKASAAARWEGGGDLAVPVFTPPVLITAGGRNFFLTDATENMGNVAAPPSVTRYYIYPNRNFDPSTAQVVGERAVPALQPDEASISGKQTFVVPANLPAGTYYLAACADANSNVVELDETNNCSFNTLERRISIIQVMESPKNQPPVCNLAAPSVATLWPPNHKLVDIVMLGITDPDNDPVSIKITGITQDEPVNGLGDGDTAPDGFGVGTIQAQVRAERSGTGNGRVYAISFMADDGKGGTCSGKVSVGVPHDQGQGSVSVDDGQNYDSTGI